MGKKDSKKGILLVANYASDVGYAWWLMESFWIHINKLYADQKTVFLCYPRVNQIPKAVKKSRIATKELDFSTSKSSLLKQIQFIKKYKIECIYYSDQPMLHWRYAIFRCVGIRKIIVHDHTPGMRTQPTGIKKLLKTLVMRAPWITADAYIGATPFIQSRGETVGRIPKYKCFNAPNGIPSHQPNSKADVHKLFDIPITRQIMVCTGRAHSVKGIDFALRCIAKIVLRDKESRLHFLFCGDGPLLDELKNLSRELNIESHVTFAGKRQDVRNILPNCNFAFHPSKAEVGYSLSILEYMQAKLPVIVSDNPSVCGATIHNETGLIYKEHDLDSACNAIKTLLSDQEATALMGSQSGQTLTPAFQIENTHSSLTEIFHQVFPVKKR
ncbi:glycosyltransferase family 4 protein [bacterium]|nr:glycosyltransferase family 4 protein [bacterium]